ncbi:hypothetical protein PMAYCL1PPCAC_16520, partial [Pristionchus mayeri]
FLTPDFLTMSQIRIWFWIPVGIVLVPSTILHVRLLLIVRALQRRGQCKSLFFRIFFVQWLDGRSDLTWCIMSTAMPFVMLFRQLLQDNTYFRKDALGIVAVYSPPHVIQSNGTQAAIVTAIGSVFSAICYILVVRRLVLTKKMLKIPEYRRERMCTLVGLALFVSLCCMTGYYFIVIFAAFPQGDLVLVVRHFYIAPVLLMTFINPWMLMITDRIL